MRNGQQVEVRPSNKPAQHRFMLHTGWILIVATVLVYQVEPERPAWCMAPLALGVVLLVVREVLKTRR